MIRFRTEVTPKKPPFTLSITKPVFCIGSCFAQLIGQKLTDYKFDVLVNPFGTIFNPLAIGNLITKSLQAQAPNQNLFLHYQERYLSYEAHSKISATTSAALANQLTNIQQQTHAVLTNAQTVILTFGSAWVYELSNSATAVANCHKQPQKAFTKRLVSPNEITTSVNSWYKLAKSLNPDLNIIVTVSPVRHEKDGLEENNLSKSVLRYAAYQLTTQHTSIYYFPSYEILIDDLRDYRYYSPDLLHPSGEAEYYIWEKFYTTLFTKDTQNFTKNWLGIRTALQHRPFNPGSAAHQAFLKATLKKLQSQHWPISVTNEVDSILAQLQTHDKTR